MQQQLSRYAVRFSATAITGVLDAVVLWCVRPADQRALIVLVALATACILLSAIFRIAQLLAPGLLLLGAAFMAIDELRAIARPLVVPYAFGLFLVAELGYESVRTQREPGGSTIDRGRLLYLGVVSGCSLVVSIVVLGAAAMVSVGIAAELVGLGAAVGTVGWTAFIITKPQRATARVRVPDSETPRDRQPPGAMR